MARQVAAVGLKLSRCLSSSTSSTSSAAASVPSVAISRATLQQQHAAKHPLPPLVYHPEYSFAGWDTKHRFVMDKFRHLYELLLQEPQYSRNQAECFHLPPDPAEAAASWHSGATAVSTPVSAADGERVWDFTGPEVEAIDRGWLGLAHCPEYVASFCAGTFPGMRRIGLPWSKRLVRRTRLEVSGTILAAELALEYGLACNLAGGTHHAHYSEGSGFTIFNDLVVAARVLISRSASNNASASTTHPPRQQQQVRKVLIVDLDVHQGDGTASLVANDESIFALSFHCESNFPLRKYPSDLDVGLPDGVCDQEYIHELKNVPTPGIGICRGTELRQSAPGLGLIFLYIFPGVGTAGTA